MDDGAPALGGNAAGFWRRFAGSLIDGIILSIVGGVASLLLGFHRQHGVRIFIAGGDGINLLFSVVYFTYFHGRTGQTPGNAALGIRVVDLRDGTGGPIGYQRAFLRWLVSIPSALIVGLGYFWMLWDDKKQTWHDKAAGSLPVHVGN